MKRFAAVLALAALLLACLLAPAGCGRRGGDAARQEAAPAADALSGASVDPALVRSVEAAMAEPASGPVDQDMLDLLCFQRALHDISIVEDEVMMALIRQRHAAAEAQPGKGEQAKPEPLSGFSAAFKRARSDLAARPVSAAREALRTQFVQALDTMTVAYELLERKGVDDPAVDARFKSAGPVIQACFQGLGETFSMERLLGVGLPELTKMKDEADKEPSPEYQAAEELAAKGDTLAAYEAFAALADRHPGGPLELRCRVRLADFLLRDPTSPKMRAAGHTLDMEGLTNLRRVVDAGIYMPSLYEGWRKWRLASEFVRGDTTITACPNRAYNFKRYQVLMTIRHHLREQPQDLWARFQFVALAQHDILRRVGPDPRMSPLGQEWMTLYPE